MSDSLITVTVLHLLITLIISVNNSSVPYHVIVVDETDKLGRKSAAVSSKRSQFPSVCLTCLYTCKLVSHTHACALV